MSISHLSELTETPSWSSRKTPVTCINVIQETVNVKTFQFEAVEKQLFHFKPGQFIGIQVEIDGERHNRSYTIASTPSRPHILEITVKKEDDGAVSPWLHENIKLNSTLEVRGPAGRFNCFDTESDKVLLISAGSGITPMMSMARFWTDTQPSKDIHFLNWVRSVEDIIFRRELSLLDHNYEKFQLEVICTQPGLSENWLGRRGRVSHTALQDIVPDLTERVIFCCGPDGFMQQVKACLQSLEFNMDNYHDESFDPGGKKKAKLAGLAEKESGKQADELKLDSAVGPYQLTLTNSNRVIVVEDNDILLEKLEAEGVKIDSACRAGNCGSCQVKKIKGETTTENEAGLNDEEKQQGFILTCTTLLKSDTTLEI